MAAINLGAFSTSKHFLIKGPLRTKEQSKLSICQVQQPVMQIDAIIPEMQIAMSAHVGYLNL